MTQRDVKLTEAQELQAHWDDFCDSDPFEGSADFIERMEAAGFAQLRPVTEQDLHDISRSQNLRGMRMGRDIWVISDTHFGHSNIIGYCDRPFVSADEMDATIVERWNDTVRDQDIVYHLGDVYFGARGAERLSQLKGRKRLILGNHDNGKDQKLLGAFQKILVWRMFPEFGLLLTHVPVHEDTLRDKCPVNVHGHIHERTIPDPRYINVSVEQTNYAPVNIETLANKDTPDA